MKILLHDNYLSVRGTAAAMYDYALYLKQLYSYECVITFNGNDEKNDPRIINKFKKEFVTVPYYSDFSEVDIIIKSQKIDLFYIIKAGDSDGKVSQIVKTCVHAVFPCSKQQRHGDRYAYISSWLSEYCSGNEYPYVPHMLNLPTETDNYRDNLSIPKDAIVFGRYGGYDTFDLPIALNAVKRTVEKKSDVFFLFCNTPVFLIHPRVIFINSTASLNEKVKFINTCDAFLHGRYRGETFGLSILEFMSKGKPVFTYKLSEEQNHYRLLQEHGKYYTTEQELVEKMLDFKPHHIDYSVLQLFNPNKVMSKFQAVFIN